MTHQLELDKCIEARINPFGSPNGTKLPMCEGARIPDSYAHKTGATTLTASTRFVTDANTVNGYLKMTDLHSATLQALLMLASPDPNVACVLSPLSGQPPGNANATGADACNLEWDHWDTLNGLCSQWRIVGGGVRLNVTGFDQDSTEGVLYGGCLTDDITDAFAVAGNTITAASLITAIDRDTEDSANVEMPIMAVNIADRSKDGITVRFIDTGDGVWAFTAAAAAAGDVTDYQGFEAPIIVWQGLAVGVTVCIDCILHIEFSVTDPTALPRSLKLTQSPYDPDVQGAMHHANDTTVYPVVTYGHSFLSVFVNKVKLLGKRAASATWDEFTRTVNEIGNKWAKTGSIGLSDITSSAAAGLYRLGDRAAHY